MNLGIWKVQNAKKCGVHYSCTNIATHYIGDKDRPQDPHNMMLCEEHLEMIYNKLVEMYGANTEPPKADLNVQTDGQGIINQELTNKYLNMAHDNSGMLSKDKLIEFCNENKIELPENPKELNVKKFMEIIFPEILIKDGEETNVQATE